MSNILLYGISAVPAILGLVQVAKTAGLPTRFSPALSVILGIGAGLAQTYANSINPVQAVFLGIALGLSAAGLYSGSLTLAASGREP